jgi:hypothetical protein
VNRRLKQVAVVFVIVFAAAQLLRPERANPPTDPKRAIQAYVPSSSELPGVLNRACGNCHSNDTVWPWYSQLAPASWVVVRGVREGRTAVNFSDWGGYRRDQQRVLLAASCDDARAGRMPVHGYTLLYPAAQLSNRDIDIICAAAQQVGADRHDELDASLALRSQP